MRPLLLVVPLASLGLGCSAPAESPEPPPVCAPFDYASYAPKADPSFADDVVPILARSCAFSVCHGSTTGPQAGLYLGPNITNTADKAGASPPYYPPDASTIAEILGNLVGGKALETSDMPIVAAADPEHSYLMHKIDGDQSCSGLSCTDVNGKVDATCGDRMPQNQPPLSVGDLATIRDWIARGAKND